MGWRQRNPGVSFFTCRRVWGVKEIAPYALPASFLLPCSRGAIVLRLPLSRFTTDYWLLIVSSFFRLLLLLFFKPFRIYAMWASQQHHTTCVPLSHRPPFMITEHLFFTCTHSPSLLFTVVPAYVFLPLPIPLINVPPCKNTIRLVQAKKRKR